MPPRKPKVLTEEKPIPDVTPRVERLEDRQGGGPVPPTTTAEQDIVTAGQRRINLVWELTQAVLAVGITLAVVFNRSQSEVLNYAFFLIVGVYFNRTNHQRIGGVGVKATDAEEYKGR